MGDDDDVNLRIQEIRVREEDYVVKRSAGNRVMAVSTNAEILKHDACTSVGMRRTLRDGHFHVDYYGIVSLESYRRDPTR